jgi:hypothetical protein
MVREGSIIEYTEQVAGEIANRHAGDPTGELQLWLRLAHQREAMVTQIYELAGFEARLREAPREGAGGLIQSVVRGIWAHEKSHTEFLSSIRAGNEAWGALAELQGLVEGWVVNRALHGWAGGRLLIAAGASLGKTPEFARSLRQMSLSELIAFSAELETTARMGYQRILQIAARLTDREAAARAYGFTFQYDVARIEREETFHEGVFLEMQSWLAQSGGGSDTFCPESGARALHRLCAETLSVGAVRRAASVEQHPGLEAHIPGASSSWVSDGGLGAVFSAAGLPVPLVEARA